MSIFFCIPGGRLSDDEKTGRYGKRLGPYADYDATFDISMCQAPCESPGCWCTAMLCLCPSLMYMRHRALNHVHPDSGWSQYKCCQGFFGGCCCLQPGSMGEKSCPIPCMCLEACLCPGLAVTSNSLIIRQHYQLGLDEDDVRLIRCNNCLQILACLCSVIACVMAPNNQNVQDCSHLVECLADVMFCCVSGCMTAQLEHEIMLREKSSPPDVQEMEWNVNTSRARESFC